MSEWKTWSKQFERDLRDAMESMSGSFAEGDAQDIAEGAADFAQTIVECAVTPFVAFLGGLPRAMDFGVWTSSHRWSGVRDWDDEN